MAGVLRANNRKCVGYMKAADRAHKHKGRPQSLLLSMEDLTIWGHVLKNDHFPTIFQGGDAGTCHVVCANERGQG